MYKFKSFERAASFAMRAEKVALVFDGPANDYVVAIGRDARELEREGHTAYSLKETARAA